MINPPTSPTLPARIGWAAHLLLRIGLAGYLFVYGWAKVFLAQMGRADFGDALVAYGEMSPMGLLWRMIGYSVPFQFLSGVAEVLAAGLLLWRRTAGAGAAIAAFDMYFVFLLNLSYDVPVKQLSLALAIGATIAAIPYATRFLRSLFTSGPLPHGPLPTIITGRAGKIINVAGAVLAVLAVITSGVLFRLTFPAPQEGQALAGVYRVVDDTAKPAAQLADDQRWQQVAFGQWVVHGKSRWSIRQANGDLRTGSFSEAGPNLIMAELKAAQRGPVRTTEPVTTRLELRWERLADGRLRLTGGGQDLTLASDPEFRFLFDRDFSWDARPPVNR
ncbi:DoxX family protein [Microlunatus parietis]|uniref:DoxX protein n=1 Tax=Microlunatus parietis TaxID=682979 RepID=A0A7Y9I9K7_9ACTN|nr:DoxX family protein [Microlunatus parietis]NYE72682.1 hypothetical protein [Microlunatus parietis]